MDSTPLESLETPGPAVNSRKWMDNLLCDKNRVTSLRPHQLEHAMDLNEGRDVFLVIATGMGKTAVLHAPLQAAQARNEKGIGLLVVPTKVLVEQQAEVASRNGLRALAIHEDTVREAHLEGRDLFNELIGGQGVSVGIMSPQMLLSPRLRKLIRNPGIKDAIRWMLIDEAHLVDETSGTFLVAYRAIVTMRALLSSHTVWAAVSGTATPSRALAIAKKLGFQPDHYVNARYSVDRPNIKYITRYIQHPISGMEFLDLSFLIPIDLVSFKQIAPTLVFRTEFDTGYRLMQYLDLLIPANFPDRLEIVKMYNSLMPQDYRNDFRRDMESDDRPLRIGIVTDTCTYGLDIQNLRLVIQFGSDIPKSPEIKKQREGRAGRDGLSAIAMSYVPSWVREVPAAEITSKQAKEDAKRRDGLPKVLLQQFNPTKELCPRAADLLYYEEEFVLRPGCCHIHDPQAVDEDLAMVERWKERTTKPVRTTGLRSDGTYQALETHMKDSLLEMLSQWRNRKWTAIRGSRIGLPSDVFMPRHIMLHVVEKAHLCTTLERLRVVADGWDHIADYEDELLQYLKTIMDGFTEVFNAREGSEAGNNPVAVDPLISLNPLSNVDERGRRLVLRVSQSHPTCDQIDL
ncbi:P-loop containing nucleoside triphosphate hydrolase protein [Crucibulum laeve]|uniref:DNA 3'-5' helicase n=1 Tax=Crucibulum laeve TaxID=68775 RepID=A0A5C3MDH0_9AGAR|nr:P-loop containing nucleoside triphosphate hydrolase protein [Crucibulum laeve]